MLSKQIKSLQHPFVKKIVKLRKDKDYRVKERLVLVLGKKVILEIAKKHSPSAVLIANDLDLNINAPITYVTESIMNKITGLHTQEKVAALFPIPNEKEISNETSILTIDGISDPGNLGTLFRSALALKFDAVILLANTVDPFNDKAIRASKGACFSLPFCFMTKVAFTKLLKEKKIKPYIADMQGIDIKKVKIQKPFALILSNEAKGKSIWPEDFTNVAIPMSEEAESLNVATCGSILMYVMKNG